MKGTTVDPKKFEPFEPLQVLNYYDGPRIFSVHAADGELCLACWSDEDEKHSRFLVVPVSEKTVLDLEAGLLSVHEALAKPQLWVVDLGHEGVIVGVWLVKLTDVPVDAQPKEGTMLHRSTETVNSHRSKLEALQIPGNIVRNVEAV